MVDEVGPLHAGDDADGEDLLDSIFELDPAEGLAAANIDGPHAADAFLSPLGERWYGLAETS